MATTPAVMQIVQRCEALFEDLDFGAVKAWKAAASRKSSSDPAFRSALT